MTPEGRAFMELMWGGLVWTFFKMPAAGKEITAFTVGGKTIGTVTPAGAGHGNGSQTMPALARMRPRCAPAYSAHGQRYSDARAHRIYSQYRTYTLALAGNCPGGR